ncbi:hypothetical protein NXZ75_12215 [Lysinibacillus sphaericus]|uniref:hypothetical protein n=1 Tax=Lysinibacillus sphaericus TaxID=1421 RepID=UPI0021637583|nr:hypothetical protein [Lysinibacillus sphaericus]MCS1382963.1 hypothetical protein [Lysinibacillus sphaericus]
MKKLLSIARHPKPFESGTQEVWLDEDVAEYVLKAHFDETIPGGVGRVHLLMQLLILLLNLHQWKSLKK